MVVATMPELPPMANGSSCLPIFANTDLATSWVGFSSVDDFFSDIAVWTFLHTDLFYEDVQIRVSCPSVVVHCVKHYIVCCGVGHTIADYFRQRPRSTVSCGLLLVD